VIVADRPSPVVEGRNQTAHKRSTVRSRLLKVATARRWRFRIVADSLIIAEQ
jgi:hypothetical protein